MRIPFAKYWLCRKLLISRVFSLLPYKDTEVLIKKIQPAEECDGKKSDFVTDFAFDASVKTFVKILIRCG